MRGGNPHEERDSIMTVAGEGNRSAEVPLPRPEHPAYRAFLHSVAVLGCAVTVMMLYRILAVGFSYHWVILTTLAVFAGAATVKIPGTQSKASISETVIFLSLILCGTPAGTITAAVDGIMGSLRAKTVSRRLEYGLFNTATMVLSASLAGEVFFWLIGRDPLISGPKERLGPLLLPLLAMALVYYLVNSGCVAVILALDSGRDISSIWANIRLNFRPNHRGRDNSIRLNPTAKRCVVALLDPAENRLGFLANLAHAHVGGHEGDCKGGGRKSQYFSGH